MIVALLPVLESGYCFSSAAVTFFMSPGDKKTLRHDADHGVAAVVEGQRASDDGRIAAEAPLPKAVTEHDDRIRSGLVFVICINAPQRGFDAQNVKHVRRHLRHSQ